MAQREQFNVQFYHRAILVQELMQRAYMTEDQCKKLVRRICNARSDAELQAVYNTLLRGAREDLSIASFMIKELLNPADKVKYVVLVNTKNTDEACKHATHLTVPQRDWFKAVVEIIANSENNSDGDGTPCASSIVLLNIDADDSHGQQVKKIGKNEKQQTLTVLVQQGWLSEAPGRKDHFCLGPRTLLELRDLVFTDNLPEATRAAWEAIL